LSTPSTCGRESVASAATLVCSGGRPARRCSWQLGPHFNESAPHDATGHSEATYPNPRSTWCTSTLAIASTPSRWRPLALIALADAPSHESSVTAPRFHTCGRTNAAGRRATRRHDARARPLSGGALLASPRVAAFRPRRARPIVAMRAPPWLCGPGASALRPRQPVSSTVLRPSRRHVADLRRRGWVPCRNASMSPTGDPTRTSAIIIAGFTR